MYYILRLTCSSIRVRSQTPSTSYYNSDTLSLHDALPILTDPVSLTVRQGVDPETVAAAAPAAVPARTGASELAFDTEVDRKSTRLNSSHVAISYAVFCLKKKK